MSFFEKIFNKNEEKGNLENSNEVSVDASAEAETKQNHELLEKVKSDLAKLEATAMELSNVDPEKAAENLAKNEALRNNLKIVAGVLTTLGFAAAMILSFTERIDATQIIENFKPMTNEIMLDVSFLATAISGAMTHEAIEKNDERKYAEAKAERLAQEENSSENHSFEDDSSDNIAA